jgi:chromosome segregation ATPase
MNSDICIIKKDIQSIKGSIKKLILRSTSPKLETQIHEQKLKIELLQNNINTLSQDIIKTQTENKFISESLDYNKRELSNALQRCRQINLKICEQNLLIQKYEININSLKKKLDTQNKKYKDFNDTLNQNILIKERLVFWIEKYEMVQKDMEKCNHDKDQMSKQTHQMSKQHQQM